MEKTLKEEYIYKGKIINLKIEEVLLPNNKKSNREIVEHRGAAAIVAIDKNNNIILVKQYRKPVEDYLLEIPAGTLEPDEEPIVCAKRELIEETNFDAHKFKFLTSFCSTPGFTTEKLYVYIATDLYKKQGTPDEDEFINIVTIPFEKAIEMVLKGEIQDAKSMISILMTSLMMEEK